MSASVLFSARGTALAARYSTGGATPTGWTSGGTQLGGALATSGYTGEIGNSSFNLKNSGNSQVLTWPGRNWITTPGFSILWRGTVEATGTFLTLIDIGLWEQACPGRIFLNFSNTSTLNLGINDYVGNTIVNNVGTASGMSTQTYYDVVLVWDGTTGANSIKLYVNNSVIYQTTAGHAIASLPYPIPAITLGGAGLGSNSYVNEFVIWSGVINPGSVLCGGSSVALNGNSRTNFVDCSAFDATVFTDPGIANVANGVSYTYAGVSETGTLVSTDPGIANVTNGVNYTINNTAKTGTNVSTDPGVANVNNGVNYTINSAAKTGTNVNTDPGVGNVVAGTNYTINSASKIGTYTEPTTAQVQHGVTFGGGIGTYRGADLWSDPGFTNVAQGVNYNANGVAETGTLGTVTNTLQNATLTGQSLTATLVQT